MHTLFFDSAHRYARNLPTGALFPAAIGFLPLTIDKREVYTCCRLSRGSMPPPSDLLQRTLDVLILRTLAQGQMHGWGVAQHIQQVSKDVLQIGQGSLYPA